MGKGLVNRECSDQTANFQFAQSDRNIIYSRDQLMIMKEKARMRILARRFNSLMRYGTF